MAFPQKPRQADGGAGSPTPQLEGASSSRPHPQPRGGKSGPSSDGKGGGYE